LSHGQDRKAGALDLVGAFPGRLPQRVAHLMAGLAPAIAERPADIARSDDRDMHRLASLNSSSAMLVKDAAGPEQMRLGHEMAIRRTPSTRKFPSRRVN